MIKFTRIISEDDDLYDYAYDKSYIDKIHSLSNEILWRIIDDYADLTYVTQILIKEYARRIYDDDGFINNIYIMGTCADIALHNNDNEKYEDIVDSIIRHYEGGYQWASAVLGLYAPSIYWVENIVVNTRLVKTILEAYENVTVKRTQEDLNYIIGLLLEYSKQFTCNDMMKLISEDKEEVGKVSLRVSLIANLDKCDKTFPLRRIYRQITPLNEGIKQYEELFV